MAQLQAEAGTFTVTSEIIQTCAIFLPPKFVPDPKWPVDSRPEPDVNKYIL